MMMLMKLFMVSEIIKQKESDMTVIDTTTDLGKLRLRVADFSDLPYLPDNVYTQTLIDNDNNLAVTAKICATYILGILSFKTHRKVGLQLENWSGEAFAQYKEFLLLTVKDPAFMTTAPPVPYGGSTVTPASYAQFVSDWKKLYYRGAEDQQNAFGASVSPNDGGLLGNFGVSVNPTYGWQATGQGHGYYP